MLWRKPHVAEMTAEARALYDEPEDAAAATILPVGAMAWDQVTEPPLRFAPWPYDNAELARIRKTLPEMSAAVAIEKALFAARWFLARNRLREIRNEPAKPDPHKELARIRDAADELLAVIKAASPQATRHLFDHPWPGAGSPPVRPGDLAYVVDNARMVVVPRRMYRAIAAKVWAPWPSHAIRARVADPVGRRRAAVQKRS
jgi:hypothetical protein